MPSSICEKRRQRVTLELSNDSRPSTNNALGLPGFWMFQRLITPSNIQRPLERPKAEIFAIVTGSKFLETFSLPFSMYVHTPFHIHDGHLNELQGTLGVLQRLREVQDLAAHHAHLLLEEVPIEALVRLGEEAKHSTLNRSSKQGQVDGVLHHFYSSLCVNCSKTFPVFNILI